MLVRERHSAKTLALHSGEIQVSSILKEDISIYSNGSSRVSFKVTSKTGLVCLKKKKNPSTSLPTTGLGNAGQRVQEDGNGMHVTGQSLEALFFSISET